MKIKLLLSVMLVTVGLNAQPVSETKAIVRKIADGILEQSTWQLMDIRTKKIYNSASELPVDAKAVIQSPYNTWHYWNGVLNLAMLELSGILDEPQYADFAVKNMRFAFDNYKWFEARHKGENKWNYPFGMLFVMDELDCCGAEGASLIEVTRMEKREDYADYIEKAAKHIMQGQVQLDDGTLMRYGPNKLTLWADDLYMSVPFLARYGHMKMNMEVFDFAVKQVKQFRKYLYNPMTELYYHCWYSDIKENGVAHWGRCNGWVMMAQVNLLDFLPEDHPARPRLLEILHEQVLGISRYQSESGLWHQVLNREDSYLETSCTAMFTWSIARSVRKGYLDKRYYSIAEKGWKGLLSKIREDGQVESICIGTGIENDMNFYYTRPTRLNDIHGLGAVLLSGIEMMLHASDQ